MVFNSQGSYLVSRLLARSMPSKNNVKVKCQGHISEKFSKTFIYTVDFQRNNQVAVTALLS